MNKVLEFFKNDSKEQIIEKNIRVYGWQNEYDEESGICDFYLSVFEEIGEDVYRRSDEHQQERMYDRSTLESLLEKSGFELFGVYADYDFRTATDGDERWYFVARAKK